MIALPLDLNNPITSSDLHCFELSLAIKRIENILSLVVLRFGPSEIQISSDSAKANQDLYFRQQF